MTSFRDRVHVSRLDNQTLVVRLTGDFVLAEGVVPASAVLDQCAGNVSQIRFEDGGIKQWDSSLLVLLVAVRRFCAENDAVFDCAELPAGICRLLDLAADASRRPDSGSSGLPDSLLTQTGLKAINVWRGVHGFVRFLGEVSVSFIHWCSGRARFRRSELLLHIQECGPEALGIVTLISVLVGAIMAFVGALQLKMFNAEIYVANLVGFGMVIEMGALMTGIILAGRTGASFAARLGTMQVNEEIDALVTLGMPPVEYLVLPRMLALGLMTPLLVIYADVLGILGGALVGIFVLDIPPALFLEQTVSMMTLWHCMQGLIKGATFGLVVAICGCLRGMQCGRSASAVGEATTSAVVTGIVAIVLADALWTFIFMSGGGLL